MFASDPALARLTPHLVELAAKYRFPASYEFREQARGATAKALGLAIPSSLLARADYVLW